MSPEENLALFKAIRDQAMTAAVPAADGMAETFDAAVGRTLRLTAHAPMPAGAPHKRAYGIYHQAVAGAPPSYATGDLARSVIRTPASGGIVATAIVGPTAIYAAVQEFGAVLTANSAYLQWHNDRGWWRRKFVSVPEHPYMRPTVDQTVADGSLSRAAMQGWMAHMSLLD